jgi:hypothetical protein
LVTVIMSAVWLSLQCWSKLLSCLRDGIQHRNKLLLQDGVLRHERPDTAMMELDFIQVQFLAWWEGRGLGCLTVSCWMARSRIGTMTTSCWMALSMRLSLLSSLVFVLVTRLASFTFLVLIFDVSWMQGFEKPVSIVGCCLMIDPRVEEVA